MRASSPRALEVTFALCTFLGINLGFGLGLVLAMLLFVLKYANLGVEVPRRGGRSSSDRLAGK